MKKVFFLSIFVLISFVSICQDIIIKKSGEEIKSKILEIGVYDIKYKRFDFQDGPVYSISKSEVVLVRYENGINEVITSTPPTNTPPIATPTETTPVVIAPVVKESKKIEYGYGSYNQNGRYISKNRITSILKDTKDPEINRLLKRSKISRTTGNIFATAIGIPLMVIGSFTMIKGAILKNQTTSGYNSYTDPDAGGLVTAGAVMAGSGLMLQFVNIGFHASSKRKFDKAIEIYNAKFADKE